MARRPAIGITTRLEHETRRFYIGRDYCEAIFAAGGTPVLVPLIPDPAYIEEIVSRLDGIFLPGCDSDPDPALYGEDPHPRLGRVVPEKDATDLAVIAEAERRGLPILGICFGMQILNVSRGGSLIQDIESQITDPILHQQGIPHERNSHQIRIEEGSLIEELAESEAAMVNSHHHQAVRAVGNGLKATSRTSDGVVESIEDTNGKPIFAVQWHPELSWQTDTLSAAIFERFVSDCRRLIVKAVS